MTVNLYSRSRENFLLHIYIYTNNLKFKRDFGDVNIVIFIFRLRKASNPYFSCCCFDLARNDVILDACYHSNPFLIQFLVFFFIERSRDSLRPCDEIKLFEILFADRHILVHEHIKISPQTAITKRYLQKYTQRPVCGDLCVVLEDWRTLPSSGIRGNSKTSRCNRCKKACGTFHARP